MKDELFSLYHEGVASITPPLKADNHIGELSQEIDDLSLAFIPPLGSYHYDACHHIPPLGLDEPNGIHMRELLEFLQYVRGRNGVELEDTEGFATLLVSAELHISDIYVLCTQDCSYIPDDPRFIEGID